MEHARRSKIEEVRRIAVLRASGIGDLVFSLPALEALRRAYPRAEIVYLGLPWHQEILGRRPVPVDRVVAVPPGSGLEDDGAARARQNGDASAFFRRLRDERLDLAIQLHGGGRRSNPFVRRLGARVTAGMRSSDAEALDRWVPYTLYQPEVLRLLEVVGLVGARGDAKEPELPVTAGDLEEAATLLPEDRGEPLVAMHVGVTDPRRRWPLERFAYVADSLARDGCRIALIGGPEDRELAAKVADEMLCPALDLSGRLSVAALVGVLTRSAVVISNDSGPLHLARAVGTPTVGIFWCGNLVSAGPLTRTIHRPLTSWCVRCPVCDLENVDARCPHDPSFVAGVAVEDVLAEARDLLATFDASESRPSGSRPSEREPGGRGAGPPDLAVSPTVTSG